MERERASSEEGKKENEGKRMGKRVIFQSRSRCGPSLSLISPDLN